MASCGYSDCDHSEPVTGHPERDGSPILYLCPCEKKRPLVVYEHLGTNRSAPYGQRYDTRTGNVLYRSSPEVAHYAVSSRGGQIQSRFILPLPEENNDSRHQIFPSTEVRIPLTNRMAACAPPFLAGRYLIHRAWSGDRYLVWSLTSGNAVHQIQTDPLLGLGASPVWDGSGIGMFTSPQQWERYGTTPDFDPQPLSLETPMPVCDNAAPLIVTAAKHGDVHHESRFVCMALTGGLALLPLNTLDVQNPRLTFLKQWRSSKDYHSPVWFSHRGQTEGSALVTTHPNGSLHAVYLSEDFEATDEITLDCLDHRSTALLPPVITPEGLWLIRLTEQGFDLTCLESSADFRNPWVWHSIPTFSPTEETTLWTPVVIGKLASPEDPHALVNQPRLVILGRGHFYDLNRYRLQTGGMEMQPPANYPGIRFHPALGQVDGNRLILGDYLTGNVYLYFLPESRFVELSPLGTHLRDLIGGPAIVGKTILWPTRFGLHTQPLETA